MATDKDVTQTNNRKGMIRHKWILKVRNQLANLAGECDSCAAIEGAKLSTNEREKLQTQLRDAVKWIDKKLGFGV